MKKNKLEDLKLNTSEVTEIVSLIFSRFNPSDKKRIYEMIDSFILDLGVSENEIPWMNKKKNNIDGYCNLLDLMRLCYAKILDKSEIRFKKKVH